MEPQTISQPIEVNEQKHVLHQVTPLSKYLAMALFVILPFLGGWIGYTYAPEKVVEVERVVVKSEAVAPIVSETGNGIDEVKMTTFAADTRYKTDGTNVYLFDDFMPIDDDDTVKKYTLEGADPATFEPFIVRFFEVSQGNTYRAWISRDKNSVYYQNKKVEGADPATFVITDEVPITKDHDDVFLYFEKIPMADPETYDVVFNTGGGGRGKVFGKDASNCYLEYKTLNCDLMPASFEEAVNFKE